MTNERNTPDWAAAMFWLGAWATTIVWLLIDNGVI